MLKSEIREVPTQASRSYFPVRHWRHTSIAKPIHSNTAGNEFKRPIIQLAKSLEIALRSFNKYGG